MRMTAAEVARATGGRLSGPDIAFAGVSIDTREITAEQLFVPIVADRDGHDYLAHAAERGVRVCVTSRATPVEVTTAVEVDDTLVALAAIGRRARDRLADRVVAVTGSVGKTSVKDLTRAALAPCWRVTASVRSYNNEIGLPLTLANAPHDTEVAVVEMGMRGLGQISALCEIARPTVGVVTSVARAHTHLTGGIDGVARAKEELVISLPKDGLAVLNADDERVLAMASSTEADVITFGSRRGDVRAVDIRLDGRGRAAFRLVSPWGEIDVQLAVSGGHNAANAAAAAAVALGLGTPIEAVAEGLRTATLSPWRMEVRHAPSGTLVVNDAYNANPASMTAALDLLAQLPVCGRRVAVLGLMAELDQPAVEHAEIAVLARTRGLELIAVGTDLYGEPAVADIDEALTALGRLGPDDAVLVKASRVAGLERLAALLLEE